MDEGRRFAAKKSIGNGAEYNARLARRYDVAVSLEDQSLEGYVVRAAGIEPARHFWLRILSPVRLPVPSCPRI